LTQRDIIEAIKRGRVWISENPTSYTLIFTGETGKSRAGLGGVLDVRPNSEVKFRFSGTGFPPGAVLKLVSKGAAVKTSVLDKADFSEELIAKPSGNEYFRVEVRNASGKMLAFTNPIYTREKP
jgi:hypothetical protein